MKARGPPTKMALERVRKLGQGNFGVAVLARLDGMHDTELFVLAVCERCLAERWHVQRVFFQNVVCFVSHPRNRDHGLLGRGCVWRAVAVGTMGRRIRQIHCDQNHTYSLRSHSRRTPFAKRVTSLT
jgi:hypothetical protein